MVARMKKWWMALTVVVAIGLAATAAYAMAVQPIILDLLSAGRRTSAVITVENTFQTPLPVELTAVVAEIQPDGTLRPTEQETDDLLVFPPAAIIQPGRSQTFRVQYVGEPDIQTSRHYMVRVAQQPVAFPSDTSAVQVVYNFQVIVNVGVVGQRPNVRVIRGEIENVEGQPRAALLLENDAPTYGYLAAGGLRIVQKDESGREIFRTVLNSEEIVQQIGYGMVAANGRRRLVTPIALPQMGGTLEVQYAPGR